MPTLTLPQGTLHYQESGNGAPIVLIHGLWVNHRLWRNVIPTLARQFRVIAPDLPLGAHSTAMSPHADLTPIGVARLIADLIAALDLQDVTLVANDTGGAIIQILITEFPERIGRVIFTNCDAFENFYPPVLRPLQYGARIPGFTWSVVQLTRIRHLQRLITWCVAHQIPDDAILDAFFTPAQRDPAVLRDLRKFLVGVSNRYTLAAAQKFGQVTIPVLIVWGKDDWIFTPPFAQRLKDAFPDVRLVWVANARAFVPEDQPDVLAQHITEFSTARSVVGDRVTS
ncbi:MAG: alpha/beta hydrolase [Anaerolineae bacterium]|jgi:pimeloyl-ACP methyl ester carboxylesterase|nr:alpha/beta hydrolase [Anaerolineae bacterium]